jgi:hypothetical protein
VTFALSEPPSFAPVRGISGTPIKAKIIRAMEEQLQVERSASEALDAMIGALRSLRNTPPPRLVTRRAKAV